MESKELKFGKEIYISIHVEKGMNTYPEIAKGSVSKITLKSAIDYTIRAYGLEEVSAGVKLSIPYPYVGKFHTHHSLASKGIYISEDVLIRPGDLRLVYVPLINTTDKDIKIVQGDLLVDLLVFGSCYNHDENVIAIKPVI